MAKKPLSREAKKHKDEESPLPTAKKAIAKVPEKKAVVKVPEKVETPITPPEPVIAPVVETKNVKPKKARFVREKKEKKPQTNAAPLPPRSTKAAAKIMSKKLAIPPKAEPNFGTKPKP
ncbi:MAG TPA: hypothetical protein VG122_21060 [Gemmata sp.]|jgi:hypothetical protein|nr:hypothetical protein [Gemmata sp.]